MSFATLLLEICGEELECSECPHAMSCMGAWRQAPETSIKQRSHGVTESREQLHPIANATGACKRSRAVVVIAPKVYHLIHSILQRRLRDLYASGKAFDQPAGDDNLRQRWTRNSCCLQNLQASVYNDLQYESKVRNQGGPNSMIRSLDKKGPVKLNERTATAAT